MGETEKPESAAEQPKTLTLERVVAVINVIVLLVGAVLVAFEFPTKFGTEKLAYAASLQSPTVPSATLSACPIRAFDDKSVLYDVNYDVSTKNQSSQPIRITYSIAQLYVGELHEPKLGVLDAYEINDPPTPWDQTGQGAVTWQLVKYDASMIDGNDRIKVPELVTSFFASKGIKNLSPGGGMTGIVAPGDTTGTSPHFFLRAQPGRYVGAVVAYGIDDAVSSPNAKINLTSDTQLLEPMSAPPDECPSNLNPKAKSPG